MRASLPVRRIRPQSKLRRREARVPRLCSRFTTPTSSCWPPRTSCPRRCEGAAPGLDSIRQADVLTVCLRWQLRDLFYYVDRLIVRRAVKDVGGRLHTARSRNDIDADDVSDAAAGAHPWTDGRQLRPARIAARPRGPSPRTVFAVMRTRTRSATTVAHYLLAGSSSWSGMADD